MKPTCLIIDDEPIAREGLAAELSHQDLFSVKGSARSASEALQMIREINPDLLFVDIELGDINGLEFIAGLAHPPMVIITTAYPQFALQGYELNVIDYLLKPISPERLKIASLKALERNDRFAVRHVGDAEALFVKCDGAFKKILYDDILFIEGANNYIFIHTTHGKLLVYQTLKKIKEQLPPERFVHIHRSFILSRQHVTGMEDNAVVCAGQRISLSRESKKIFLKEFVHRK